MFMKYTDIVNFEGLYQISNTGKVRALSKEVKMPKGGVRTIDQHYPKLVIHKKGYLKVMLTNAIGVRKGFFVHRLVAEAFINLVDKKHQVNHKDGNKQNNSASNLEWVTGSENMRHFFNKKKTSSKYFGVTKQRNKWQAQIGSKYIGIFNTEEEAKNAVLIKLDKAKKLRTGITLYYIKSKV